MVIQLRCFECFRSFKQFLNNLPCLYVERNHPLASFRLARLDCQRPIEQVDISPTQILQLATTHGRIERKYGGPTDSFPKFSFLPSVKGLHRPDEFCEFSVLL